ncbi:MAG: hypothetical protein MUO42_06580 [Anaerolineaceae bacterium]|nr:hypothetical protein [Anaerolineaceae bacterium]
MNKKMKRLLKITCVLGITFLVLGMIPLPLVSSISTANAQEEEPGADLDTNPDDGQENTQSESQIEEQDGSLDGGQDNGQDDGLDGDPEDGDDSGEPEIPLENRLNVEPVMVCVKGEGPDCKEAGENRCDEDCEPGEDCCEEVEGGIPGCMDETAINYDPCATIPTDTCEYEQKETLGCTDEDAKNYDPAANVDDGSCKYKKPGGGGGGGGTPGPVSIPVAAGGPVAPLIIPVTGLDLNTPLAGLQKLFMVMGLMFFGVTMMLEGFERRFNK